MKRTKYNKRHIAKVTVECATPIAVGSGVKEILTDAPVLLDANGLPYLPGTTLAGVIRHAVGNDCKAIFGCQGKTSSESHGSEIIFSEGRMVGADGKVVDGLSAVDWADPFYARFKELPIRQHVRINSKGTAVKMGKFDQQVVYKGSRFCFEIEFLTDGSNEELFNKVIDTLGDPFVRFGSGTRKGFGLLSVVGISHTVYDLREQKDLQAYLDKSSRLEVQMPDSNPKTINNKRCKEYRLTLKPNDFFCFSSGFGNDRADITPAKESFIDWTGAKPRFVNAATLIPATSLKGAIAHRTAYHWNRLNCRFAGTDKAPLVAENNPAIVSLFGKADAESAVRGNVIFSDIIEKDKSRDKVLQHVSIDRFTGGAIDGALFSEETVYSNGSTYSTAILVDDTKIQDATVMQAFEAALNDICNGLLPLGGGNNRGNGIFTGELQIK